MISTDTTVVFMFVFVFFFSYSLFFFFFFFNDTATTEIYTLSLHDALPISTPFSVLLFLRRSIGGRDLSSMRLGKCCWSERSEEHTSELQSLAYLVCRLLLEKKKKNKEQISTRLETLLYVDSRL